MIEYHHPTNAAMLAARLVPSLEVLCLPHHVPRVVAMPQKATISDVVGTTVLLVRAIEKAY